MTRAIKRKNTHSAVSDVSIKICLIFHGFVLVDFAALAVADAVATFREFELDDDDGENVASRVDCT